MESLLPLKRLVYATAAVVMIGSCHYLGCASGREQSEPIAGSDASEITDITGSDASEVSGRVADAGQQDAGVISCSEKNVRNSIRSACRRADPQSDFYQEFNCDRFSQPGEPPETKTICLLQEVVAQACNPDLSLSELQAFFSIEGKVTCSKEEVRRTLRCLCNRLDPKSESYLSHNCAKYDQPSE